MLVHTTCHFPDGFLGDAGKDGIAEFLGNGCAHASEAVWFTSQSRWDEMALIAVAYKP
jgi:hypothetical protein